MSTTLQRDHGGGLDAAIARYGGARENWLDLSTGINPHPYPVAGIPAHSWTALPDRAAAAALEQAARAFWKIPEGAGLLAAPGASALIAQIPALTTPGAVEIPAPTYNEHRAAFEAHGWSVGTGTARVLVNPNNPDGRIWTEAEALAGDPQLLIIDESFADVTPDQSLIHLATRPGTLVLKSFGKFWGLAGLRLGFAIGDVAMLRQLADRLGPWPVSGPAQAIGARALADQTWAETTRQRLTRDAARLDALMTGAHAQALGGTPLFRLYQVDDAATWQDRLARHHVWSRIFPYSQNWLRLGLPPSDRWPRLETAIAGACGTAGGAMPLAASASPTGP